MSRSANATSAGSLELAVGRMLRLGITASSLCLGVGLALALSKVDAELSRRLLTMGMVMLLATPAARVVVSVVDYVRERD
jgi:uncharacterized membrane protein